MRRNAFAALAALCLCACGSASDPGGDDGGIQAGTFSLFDPVAASPTVPFPFDGFFAGATEPTLNIPNASNAPFVTQANLLDGFSTSASAFTDLLGPLDYSSLAAGLLVIDSATGALLRPGVDYTTQPSVAIATNPLSLQNEPISSFRSRVLIEPLKPLAPATRYVVVLTRALRSTDGRAAEPSSLFTVARSGTPVAEQTAPVRQVAADGVSPVYPPGLGLERGELEEVPLAIVENQTSGTVHEPAAWRVWIRGWWRSGSPSAGCVRAAGQPHKKGGGQTAAPSHRLFPLRRDGAQIGIAHAQRHGVM